MEKKIKNSVTGRKFALRFLFVISLFTIHFTLFTRCANQVAPQGGPKDSLPPVVKLVTPGGGRNVKPTRIFIEFDEYVQLKEASKEFFTSPLMKTKPMLSIRGRGVRVDIKDTLADNTTYALNFGSAIADNNEGNPLYGFRYVFSTGSAIDSLLATGYVADAMRGDSVSKATIFFFDAALDTIPDYDSMLFNQRPAKIARAENNGIFVAQNLGDTKYKVYAFFDSNNNQRYDPGTDKVGFLDSVISPASLAPTSLWLDEYRRYPTAEPQTYFRLFAEPPSRRQNLNGSERPGQHQVVMRFAAPRPRIDTLSFVGIDDKNIVREYVTATRDTMNLWFNVPSASMPDTLRGRISYLKPDSLGNMMPTSQDLRLPWRKIESREEAREREREEKDRARAAERGEEYTPPKKPNPFRFKVDAGTEVNPEKSIPIEFGMPLASLDSARIVLQTVPDMGDPEPVPFRVIRDTMNIRRWVVTAAWDDSKNYRLTVPAGVFVNVAGERNDSLSAKFKIQKRDSYGSLAMTVTGRNSEARYIVELVDKSGATLREVKNAANGKYDFYYLPEGELRVRITEDGNANGRWDSGSLVERRQPERTEFYVSPTGDQLIALRPNWQTEVTIDMDRVFAPVSIDKIRADLQRAEDARVSKYLEEKAARDAERRRRGNVPEGEGGGLGIGSALGGAKDQIQSAVMR